MKNRFGFIPIVLPAIVMVLIIGLINLAGPQGVQAQAVANVAEEDARLTALSLTHTETTASDNLLMPAFEPGRGNYTATVDYQVTSATVAGTAGTGYTATYAFDGANTGTGATIDTTNAGVTTITVTVTQDPGGVPAGATAKTATYVIKLTKTAPVVHVNGPRLSALGLTSGEAGGAEVDLMRMNGAGIPGTFADIAGVNMFKASVPFTVRSVLLTATPIAGVEISSRSPSKRAARETFDDVTATDTDELYRVQLNPGQTRDIVVRTRATDGSSNAQYTIKVERGLPLLASGGITIGVSDGSTAPTLDPTFAVGTREYTVEVPFAIDSTTVVAATETNAPLKRITENGRAATTSSSAANPHNVMLPVGKTVVGIEVDQSVRDLYNAGPDTPASDQNRTTSTGMYSVTIERAKPMLAVADADTDLTNDGLTLLHEAVTPVSGDYVLDPAYSPTEDTYTAKVPYHVGFVTIRGTAGTSPAKGDDNIRVIPGFTDANDDINGYQVELGPGTSKTVTVSARSRFAKTDYQVTLMRERTPLDSLALCKGSGVDPCDAPTASDVAIQDPDDALDSTLNGERLGDGRITGSQIGLVLSDSGTTTPHEFNMMPPMSAATRYMAEVDYPVMSVTVSASNSDPTNGRMIRIATSSDGYVTTGMSHADLMVGDNVISVKSGVTGNTSTYEVTVKRKAPEPVIQFSLYDSDGVLMSAGTTTLSLMLDASIRNYTFTESDGFTVDVASVRMNAFVEDQTVRDNDDVRVSVGRVTVPITDEKILPGQEITGSTYVDYKLDHGSNTLVFDVDYRVNSDDNTLNGESTHRLTINRAGNSVPTFRPNNFDGTLHHLVFDEEIDTSTTRITLPYARGGNLGRSYSLEGSPALPFDMNAVLPEANGSETDGYLGGTPKINPDGLFADHLITLKVVDGDDITKDDDDTLQFTLRIWNSREDYNRYGPGAPAARDWGELMAIGVYHMGDEGDSCDAPALARRSGDTSRAATDRPVCAELMPTFDPSTRTFSVTVPTDVDTVDIHSIASSTASVTLRGLDGGGSPLGAGGTVYTSQTHGGETGSRHEWNGYQLANGTGGSPAPNAYRMSVKDGPNGPTGDDAVTVDYTLTITRESDTRAQFSAADKAGQPKVVQVYAGIPLDGASGNIKKVKLPLAMPDSGNGASSTWMYSLKHDSSPGGNFGAGNSFEGLTFMNPVEEDPTKDPGKNPPALMGTPVLDASQLAGQGQLSNRSFSRVTYSVKDNDNNTSASDGDKISYIIIAHRDVTLESYTVGTQRMDSTDLDTSSRMIPSDWSQGNRPGGDDYSDYIYSHETIPTYTFSVPYNATSTTFEVETRDSGAKVVVSQGGTAIKKASEGHYPITLAGGDNVVTVTVSNNGVMAKHLINLSRPGLQAESITVETDEGTPVGADAAVQLVQPDGTKGFVRNVYDYTAEVETWIQMLRIAADPVDDSAIAFVNGSAIPGATEYSVVRLGDAGTSKTYTVHIRIPGQNEDSRAYTIEVTRKADVAPSFGDATVPDKTYQSGLKIGALKLPKATGGNGKSLTYSVNDAPLLGIGLNFDPASRQITGTPLLDRGQSMAVIYVTYKANDADANKADSDAAMLMFSITVQREQVTQPPPSDGFGPGESQITLNTLEVHFRRPGDDSNVYRAAALSPAFDPQTTAYSVEVPHDYTFAWVTARPSDAGAGVYIDDVLQNRVSRAPINGTTAEIVVQHSEHLNLGTMTYSLTLSPTEESVPSFVGQSIDDETFIAGEAIEPIRLPEAMGGNAPVDYMLMYDAVNEVGVTGVGGLHFDPNTRMLSGTPTLDRSEAKVIYAFTYVGEDDDGDTTTPPLTFKVTVCESEDLPGCEQMAPEPTNPGFTPVELMVDRSSDGMSAMLTWTPGADAASQAVLAIDPSDLLASALAAFAELDGDADMATISGLTAGVDYIYIVAGFDADGNHKDASGTMYFARYVEGMEGN